MALTRSSRRDRQTPAITRIGLFQSATIRLREGSAHLALSGARGRGRTRDRRPTNCGKRRDLAVQARLGEGAAHHVRRDKANTSATHVYQCALMF